MAESIQKYILFGFVSVYFCLEHLYLLLAIFQVDWENPGLLPSLQYFPLKQKNALPK